MPYYRVEFEEIRTGYIVTKAKNRSEAEENFNNCNEEEQIICDVNYGETIVDKTDKEDFSDYKKRLEE